MASPAAFREQICCFGDSITQHGSYGWVSQLQEFYRRRCDVFNRGYSGYNTAHGRAMTRFVLAPTRKFLLTTVFFGANDQADAVMKPDQHVPVAAFSENLAEIVDAARKCSRVTVVIAPPPVDAGRWPDRTLGRATRYGLAARDVVEKINAAAAVAAEARVLGDAYCAAEAPRVLFLDTFALFTEAGPPKPVDYTGVSPAKLPVQPAWGPTSPADPPWFAYLSDGLHLSPAGNQLLFDGLVALLRERAPSVCPEAMTIDFPVFRDIPAASVADSFSTESLLELHSKPREIP